MINELHQLVDSLDNANIIPTRWHTNLKPVPNEPCYKISIADGEIDDIILLDKHLIKKLRKWEKENGISFPGFKIFPFYNISNNNNQKKKKIKELSSNNKPIDMEDLKKYCSDDNWGEKEKKRIEKCLQISQKLFLNSQNFNFSLMQKTFNQFINKTTFRDSLELLIWKNISNGENLEHSLKFLIGSNKISVFLDIKNYIDFPLANEESIKQLNKHLLKSFKTSTQKNKIDAFGDLTNINKNKSPEVILKHLGKVILRSMSKESPCQYRYNTICSESFPIGQEKYNKCKDALEWFSDESRENKTWIKVNQKEILFAYSKKLPEISPIASCFNIKIDKETSFENISKKVFDNLKGITTDISNIELKTFLIKKIDQGRTSVVLSRDYSAQHLYNAIVEWKLGCSNIPEIYFNIKTPFPLEINYNISTSQAISLFLDKNSKNFIICILNKIFKNFKMLSINNQLNENNINYVYLIGFLFYKLNIRKENYMANAPFLIGRILKISDDLHSLYCKNNRSNGLPKQLVGNTFINSASTNPINALDRLFGRIRIPYLSWAQTICDENNDIGLVKYYLQLYANIANQLINLEIPKSLNNIERVQLFLGYLASNPKKSKV